MRTKNDYLTDPQATTMPWLASPFADKLIDESNLSPDWKHSCKRFAADGFIVVDLGSDFVSSVVADMEKYADKEYVEHFYDKDADHPRYFDLWRKSQAVTDLARHPRVLETLRVLYQRQPLPFQTINFKAASEQLAHSDLIHFASSPERWVTGVAVYLEDTDENNGPFMLYPGSHNLPFIQLNDIGLFNPSADNARETYRAYEQFMQAVIEYYELEMYPISAPAGSAIIFDANILHGGAPVIDKGTTRLSQVTHYFYEGCEQYYCPLFSDSHQSRLAHKNMSDKDILGHEVPNI